MPSAIYYFSRAFVRQSFSNFVKFRENTSETKDEVCVKVILFQKSDFYPLVLKENHLFLAHIYIFIIVLSLILKLHE
jgi:hypothetical protein